MQGIFISDLHLLSQRSVGQSIWDQQKPLIKSADAIVLGGDIFDFRWSRMGSLNATLKEAKDWLAKAIDVNPNAQWVYLMGNHDSLPSMQRLLEQMHHENPRFHWSPDHYQLGRNVFLHGDILDALRHRDGLKGYRLKFHEEKPKGKVGNAMYSVVIHSRLHGAIPAVRHTRKRTCSEILKHLQNTMHSSMEDVDNIYFGHTHVPISGYRLGRYSFYNAGSGIRHLRCVPALFRLDEK